MAAGRQTPQSRSWVKPPLLLPAAFSCKENRGLVFVNYQKGEVSATEARNEQREKAE